jgi:hypothetical protein
MYEVGVTPNITRTCILSMTNLQKICKLVQKTDETDKDTEHSDLLPYFFFNFEGDYRLK